MPGNGHAALDNQITAFLSFCKVEKGLSANSLEAYSQDLRRFGGFVSPEYLSLTLKELAGPEILRRYLDSLGRSTLGGRSVARHLTTLRNFYTFLLREGQI